MRESLQELEQRRADILQQISELGDFRPGSITTTQGRCGTPNCHCHKPGEPGHGPNVRLTFKKGGKTVSESFTSLAEQRKAEREVAGFRRYQELTRTYVEVNAQVCRSRPVEASLTPQEKKRQKRSSVKRRGK